MTFFSLKMRLVIVCNYLFFYIIFCTNSQKTAVDSVVFTGKYISKSKRLDFIIPIENNIIFINTGFCSEGQYTSDFGIPGQKLQKS